MPLQYISGDIFASRHQALVNPVNTVGVMGSGLAAEFKRRYPGMFKLYKERCDSGELDVGKLHVCRTQWRLIVNFPTKKHWRNKSKLEWIDVGLKNLADTYKERKIVSIAMPQLGCGHGGLDWAEVKPLIERHMTPLSIPVHVHTVMRRRS